MSEDAFLGSFDDLVKAEEEANPDGVPDEIREVLAKFGGTVKTATMIIGPDGKPEIIEDSPSGIRIPDKVRDAMIEALSDLKGFVKAGEPVEADVPFNRALDTLRALDGVTNPVEGLVALGLHRVEAAHIVEVISEMTQCVGKDMFDERAFEAIYTQTELFEQMSFNTAMYFIVGMLTERERSAQAHGSGTAPGSGGDDSGAEPPGDTGGDREGD